MVGTFAYYDERELLKEYSDRNFSIPVEVNKAIGSRINVLKSPVVPSVKT